MTIPSHPAAIIFVNNDLSENVQAVLQRQLLISETITGDVFDTRVAADGYYIDSVKNSGLRLMVVRSLAETENRELADIVLFCKAGLVCVEVNKFGPPGKTLPIDRVYLTALTQSF